MTQLAKVTVEDLSGDNMGITELIIPAYTREWSDFNERLSDIMLEYYRGSLEEGALPSIGDFAFYLLMHASKEPKDQD